MHRFAVTPFAVTPFAVAPFVVALLTATAGCMSPPPHLDLSLSRPTLHQKLVVTLQPPTEPAAIHQLHSWRAVLATPAGVPVINARIQVGGGMPQHGHGLPTRPQVTQELAGGTYVIEGMKFSMTGWWEITLAIDSALGSDQVTFNTVVVEAGTGR